MLRWALLPIPRVGGEALCLGIWAAGYRQRTFVIVRGTDYKFTASYRSGPVAETLMVSGPNGDEFDTLDEAKEACEQYIRALRVRKMQ